jgi:GntR family transcriptional regulator
MHTFPRRVRDLLHASVRSGIYSADDRLIEDVLMHTLGASRSAVRAALQTLATEGVVYRHPGRGTIVRYRGVRINLADCDAVDNDGIVELTITDQRLVPVTDLLRERLHTDDDAVRMVENTFSLSGEIIGVRTAYFPTRFSARLYEGPVRMTAIAEGFFGLHLGHTRNEVGSTRADARTSRMLGIPLDSPVLVREQVMHDQDDQPVQVVFDQYRADRVTFVDDPA